MTTLIKAQHIYGKAYNISKTGFYLQLGRNQVPPPVAQIGRIQFWNSEDIKQWVEGKLCRDCEGKWFRENGDQITHYSERMMPVVAA